jgi:mRNA-degrading endonuclease RelE of RelBE toxin-antitoxin system
VRYALSLSSSARSYIRRQDRKTQQRLTHRLEQLREDPYDASISKQLAARGGQRSSRVGDLRILYFVEAEIRVVDVTDIGTRGQVYRA